MSTAIPSIAGFWIIESARGQTIDGAWQEERVIGGTGVLTPDGKICTFVKTSEYTLGFVGTYTFDGRIIQQSPQASTNPELEGRSQPREITLLGKDQLRLAAVDEVTGLRYELTMRRSNTVA
jgi:hypothetical protein